MPASLYVAFGVLLFLGFIGAAVAWIAFTPITAGTREDQLELSLKLERAEKEIHSVREQLVRAGK